MLYYHIALYKKLYILYKFTAHSISYCTVTYCISLHSKSQLRVYIVAKFKQYDRTALYITLDINVYPNVYCTALYIKSDKKKKKKKSLYEINEKHYIK